LLLALAFSGLVVVTGGRLRRSSPRP
jgi:hypothetical protein